MVCSMDMVYEKCLYSLHVYMCTWRVTKANKQWKDGSNRSKFTTYDGVHYTAKVLNSLHVIDMCEEIAIKEELLSMYYGSPQPLVWLVKHGHVPFSVPEAITDAHLLRLSVAMNDAGRGISVADKERRLLSTMA